MPRWIAVGTPPGWDSVRKLTDEMRATHDWRADASTTIKTVFVLGDGRAVAECSARTEEDFKAWLQKKGWKVDSISPVKLVANMGSIWEVKN